MLPRTSPTRTSLDGQAGPHLGRIIFYEYDLHSVNSYFGFYCVKLYLLRG